jgi:hypothetical protein
VSDRKGAIHYEEPCPFGGLDLDATKEVAAFVQPDLIYYRRLIRSRRAARMAEQAGLATPCPKDRAWVSLIRRPS